MDDSKFAVKIEALDQWHPSGLANSFLSFFNE